MLWSLNYFQNDLFEKAKDDILDDISALHKLTPIQWEEMLQVWFIAHLFTGSFHSKVVCIFKIKVRVGVVIIW